MDWQVLRANPTIHTRGAAVASGFGDPLISAMDTCSEDHAPPKRSVLGLILLLLASIAVVLTLRLEEPKCGPFTVGVSAIGGCDRIEGPRSLAIPARPRAVTLRRFGSPHEGANALAAFSERMSDIREDVGVERNTTKIKITISIV